jgi:hypothetical protein
MNEIEIEFKKREAAYKYFSQHSTDFHCVKWAREMYEQSKRNICDTLGLIYDEKTSYAIMTVNAGISSEQMDELIQSEINMQMVTQIKKYHSSFFGGKEFEAYAPNIKSDIEIAFLDYDTALEYICNIIHRTGGNKVAFEYLRLTGNMRFIVEGLGLPKDITNRMITALSNGEAGKFVVDLLAHDKVEEFFSDLFRAKIVTIHEALYRCVVANDQVNENCFKVLYEQINGKDYYLYPFY